MNERTSADRLRKQLEAEVQQKLVEADPDMIRRMCAKLPKASVTE
jgi:hypothetical protein